MPEGKARRVKGSDQCQLISSCYARITHKCRCLDGDATCEAGHSWHYFTDKQKRKFIHPGKSDHKPGKCCSLATED